MKRSILALLLAFSSPAWADNSLQLYQHITRATGNLVKSPDKRQAERKAAEVWARTGTAPTLAGSNGEVMYAYGQSHPEILCAPLHVCMVKLLPGDTGAVNLAIGDSVRWLVQATPAGDTSVLVLKPTEPDLRTNLVVTVPKTGHVYYLSLLSDKAAFVPEVGFYDPQALIQTQTIEDERQKAEAEKRSQTIIGSLGTVSPADLDFDYWWEGPKDDQPIRVFSAQGHVYIQMPPDLKYRNAPALFVVENGQEQLANYALKGQYFVVNQLFQEARLLLGAGDHKRIVTIHAGKRPSFW